MCSNRQATYSRVPVKLCKYNQLGSSEGDASIGSSDGQDCHPHIISVLEFCDIGHPLFCWCPSINPDEAGEGKEGSSGWHSVENTAVFHTSSMLHQQGILEESCSKVELIIFTNFMSLSVLSPQWCGILICILNACSGGDIYNHHYNRYLASLPPAIYVNSVSRF